MATISLTQLYSNLNQWPGNLLRAGSDSTVTTRTATSFAFTLGAESGFAGYKVQITGTGFTYINGVPTGGTMSALKIVAPGGGTVANVTNLTGPISTDLSQLYASMFGSPDGDGPGADGRVAWDLLTLGNDVITGTNGNDEESLVNFNQGNDTYNMLGGDDEIRGDVGTDTYNGGSGFDELTFFDSHYNIGSNVVGGIIVNVGAGTVRDVWGFTDKFTSIEKFIGSRFADVFNGTAGTQDRFEGGRGSDTFRGGGVTVLAGGQLSDDSRDTVQYNSDHWNGGKFGIVAKLETSFANGSVKGTIRDGFGNVDTVFDIDRVVGTRYADTFVGSRGHNDFTGGEGKDSYAGGGGSDRVWFDGVGNASQHGISIDLRKASGQVIDDGYGNTENLSSIEEIGGTEFDDVIIMNGADNHVEALEGQDTMTGGAGHDRFIFSGDWEANEGDVITDFVSGVDQIVFNAADWQNMTTTIKLENGNAASTSQATAIFKAGDHTLYWDPDGNGAQAMIAVVTLNGVNSLSSGDLDAF